MSDEAQLVLLGGVLSLAALFIGAALNEWNTSRREARRFRTETALELAELERLVWGNDGSELNAHLQRQETRLAIAGVPRELIRALRELSVLCWRHLQESPERSAEIQTGITREFLEARRFVSWAVGDHLVRAGTRRHREDLQRTAIALTKYIFTHRAEGRYHDLGRGL